MPQAKKPADRRQRSNRSDLGAVVALPVQSSAPATARADLTWVPEVQEQWAELWSSPLAGALKPTDVPALRRLFTYRSRWYEAMERFEAEPETTGSRGQVVASPWAAEIHRLEGAIQKLEDKCGLTPMARLRLGVTFEEGVSLANKNAQLLEAFRQSQ